MHEHKEEKISDLELSRLKTQAEISIENKKPAALKTILARIPRSDPEYINYYMKQLILEDSPELIETLQQTGISEFDWINLALTLQKPQALAVLLQYAGEILSLNEVKAQIQLGHIHFMKAFIEKMSSSTYSSAQLLEILRDTFLDDIKIENLQATSILFTLIINKMLTNEEKNLSDDNAEHLMSLFDRFLISCSAEKDSVANKFMAALYTASAKLWPAISNRMLDGILNISDERKKRQILNVVTGAENCDFKPYFWRELDQRGEEFYHQSNDNSGFFTTVTANSYIGPETLTRYPAKFDKPGVSEHSVFYPLRNRAEIINAYINCGISNQVISRLINYGIISDANIDDQAHLIRQMIKTGNKNLLLWYIKSYPEIMLPENIETREKLYRLAKPSFFDFGNMKEKKWEMRNALYSREFETPCCSGIMSIFKRSKPVIPAPIAANNEDEKKELSMWGPGNADGVNVQAKSASYFLKI